jgi:hypothetical protein
MVEPVLRFEECPEVALAVLEAAAQIGVVEMVGQQVRPSGKERKERKKDGGE